MSRRILFVLLAAGLFASLADFAEARTTRRYCSSCQRSVQKVSLPVIQTDEAPTQAAEGEPAAPAAEAQPAAPATEAPAAEAAAEPQTPATSSTTSGNNYRRYTVRNRRFRLRG
jgi:hypothetical protein